ncbi:MAG: NAD(P)/FAD-dependent oxidoreductase [Candidatus Nanopelagicales bacterium]
MTSHRTFVIVGAGLAGTRAAEELRSQGFVGRVVLVGREAQAPYDRPPLSKGYLTGSVDRDGIALHETSWYEENQIELRLDTTVVSLHLNRHEVELGGGQRVGFDRLLLATGSAPRTLAIPGAHLDGLRYLRRVGDADALRADFAGGGRRVIIVGGGWIGLEVAAAACGYGNDVTVIEPQSTVLRGALGDELGAVFEQLHRDHGVHLLLRDGVESFAGAAGHVTSVRTTSAQHLPADVVVVGVGAVPQVALASDAGLEVDNGVLVDEYLRTSHPDVFAAGDIANSVRPRLGRRLRVEHWDNARRGGTAAARSMLGDLAPFDGVPYFFTDQYDLGMEYAGAIGPAGYDRIVIRGDLAAREFIAFWLNDGIVHAGMNVNVWDVNDAIKALIEQGAAVDAARLADTGEPLDALATPASYPDAQSWQSPISNDN